MWQISILNILIRFVFTNQQISIGEQNHTTRMLGSNNFSNQKFWNVQEPRQCQTRNSISTAILYRLHNQSESCGDGKLFSIVGSRAMCDPMPYTILHNPIPALVKSNIVPNACADSGHILPSELNFTVSRKLSFSKQSFIDFVRFTSTGFSVVT
jgi:hypothetical protein